MGVPFYITSYFSLADCKILSLSLILEILVMMCRYHVDILCRSVMFILEKWLYVGDVLFSLAAGFPLVITVMI